MKFNELHTSKASEDYYEAARYTGGLPVDYKRITPGYRAARLRRERRRQRISGLLFALCVIVGAFIIKWQS